jgi:hypothetical protein
MYKLIKSSTTGKYEPMECQAQALIPSVAALQAGDYRFVKSKAFHSVIVEDRSHCILMRIGSYSYYFERDTGDLSMMIRGNERLNPRFEEYKDILEIAVEIFNTWSPFKRG